jgi:hypothetical protein
MTTVEDIERQQRIRRILFRIVFWTVIVLLCLGAGWLASRAGAHELHEEPGTSLRGPHRALTDAHVFRA